MVELTIEGIDDVVASLQGKMKRLRNLRPVWRSLLAWLRQVTIDQFATAGGRSRDRWQPLSPIYGARKSRVWPGKPILRASDRLFQSLTGSNQDSIVEIEAGSFTWGTATPYARYHQRGTARIPQRKILVVTKADRRQIIALVRAHLANQGQVSGYGV